MRFGKKMTKHGEKNIIVLLCLCSKLRGTLKFTSTLGILSSNFAIHLFDDPNCSS